MIGFGYWMNKVGHYAMTIGRLQDLSKHDWSLETKAKLMEDILEEHEQRMKAFEEKYREEGR